MYTRSSNRFLNDRFELCFHRYYGLWLWFPELFSKLDQYYANHNETKTVCQISDFQTGGDPVDPCSIPLPGNQVYIDSFLVSISALPGNIWCICHMDKFGRKFFLGKFQIWIFISDPN